MLSDIVSSSRTGLLFLLNFDVSSLKSREQKIRFFLSVEM